MKKPSPKNDSAFLKSIRIQRFRSIDDLTIKLAPITVFVGGNDSGKSNILKAINLFFNKEVVPGSQYDHVRDFSRVTAERERKADEVVLRTLVKCPHYTGKITQKRTWRDAGIHASPEEKYDPPLGKGRKIRAWYSKLNYRYVPANKESKYMQNLMRELHKLFSTTIDADIRSAANTFVDGIRKQTAPISDEIKEILGLNSRIQLPADLSAIFSLFDFETDRGVSLNQRGDGIRVRHIPAILAFLADRKNHVDRAVHGNTIWGYEEPENNLEMGAAFDQAKKFLDYSRHIQILITTHSPAFYSLIKSENCMGYHVSQSDGKTVLSEISDTAGLDKFMGIMPIVTPHISDIKRQHEKSMRQVESTIQNFPMAGKRPTIFVEGAFDEKLIKFCLNEKFSAYAEKILIVNANGAGNLPSLVKAMASLHSNNPKAKFIGLLDYDSGGKDAVAKTEGRKVTRQSAPQNIIFVSSPKIFGEKDQEACLEHLLPVEYWKHARNNNMLEETSEYKQATLKYEMSPKNAEESENTLKSRYKISKGFKEHFGDYAVGEMKKKGIPTELLTLVEKLVSLVTEKEKEK